MTITPNRDAADAMIAEQRRLFAEQPPGDAVLRIQRQMELDVVAGIMAGAADLLDRESTDDVLGASIVFALSSGLASYVLTATNGDQRRAEALGRSLCKALKRNVLERTRDPASAIVGRVGAGQRPAGRG